MKLKKIKSNSGIFLYGIPVNHQKGYLYQDKNGLRERQHLSKYFIIFAYNETTDINKQHPYLENYKKGLRNGIRIDLEYQK